MFARFTNWLIAVVRGIISGSAEYALLGMLIVMVYLSARSTLGKNVDGILTLIANSHP